SGSFTNPSTAFATSGNRKAFFRHEFAYAVRPLSWLSKATIILFFLVSPTGYPWYAIWFFLLAPFAPSAAVSSFAIFLPLYYMRFSLELSGRGAFFDDVLVPIAFGGPIAFIIIERLRSAARAL
ncbi:MAG: hypothetical protein AAGJ87_05960, partial [Pseudomonadota bacterium]